jgi:hypothetical protein
MRVMTVTCDARPFAVLRALGADEAVSEARAMAGPDRLAELGADARFDAREPTDGEMIGWLRRREPYLLVDAGAAG